MRVVLILILIWCIHYSPHACSREFVRSYEHVCIYHVAGSVYKSLLVCSCVFTRVHVCASVHVCSVHVGELESTFAEMFWLCTRVRVRVFGYVYRAPLACIGERTKVLFRVLCVVSETNRRSERATKGEESFNRCLVTVFVIPVILDSHRPWFP